MRLLRCVASELTVVESWLGKVESFLERSLDAREVTGLSTEALADARKHKPQSFWEFIRTCGVILLVDGGILLVPALMGASEVLALSFFSVAVGMLLLGVGAASVRLAAPDPWFVNRLLWGKRL